MQSPDADSTWVGLAFGPGPSGHFGATVEFVDVSHVFRTGSSARAAVAEVPVRIRPGEFVCT